MMDSCYLIPFILFQKGHGKCRPKLTEYFQLYQCLLNSAMFCTTSFFGLMWQHLNHSNLLIRSVYQLHVYFYIHMILHHLGILWYMKRILARLKKITLKVRITLFVTIIVLMWIKYRLNE